MAGMSDYRVQGMYAAAAVRATRTAVLDRDGHRCQTCGSTADLTVHHDPNNRLRMTTLCRRCHGTLDAPRAHR